MSLVSIVVPIYNTEKYLEKCIESIINQTFRDIEIILIDDGSTDRCSLICDEYAKIDSRVRVVHTQNRGVSSARNIGIVMSTGKYICFIDSDDTVENEYIEALIDSNKEEYDLVLCNIRDIYNNNISNKRVIADTLTKCFKDDYYKLVNLLRGPVVKLYKSNIIKDNQLKFREDIILAEDQIFNFDYYQYIDSYKYVDKSLYNYYHRNNGSLSVNASKRAFNSNLKKLKVEKEFYDKFQITNSNKILNDHTISSMQHFAVLNDNNDTYKDFISRIEELILFLDCQEKTISIKRKICLFLLRNRFYFAFYLYVILKNANINAFRCR